MNEPNTGYQTLNDLAPPQDTTSFDNFFTSNEEVSRSQHLEKAKQSKLKRLSSLNQKASLDNSYTDLGNGRIESNRNKVWNELDDQQFQSVFDYGVSKYTLTKDAQGNLVYGSGERYTGPTRRLYMFGTNDSDTGIKFGVARGDLEGSEARYTPEGVLGGYGWTPGEYGVNTEDKRMDVLLPDNVATLLEGLGHGRAAALENRAVKDSYEDPDLTARYGDGVTEYYTSKEGLFGTPTTIDPEMGRELFTQYLTDIQKLRPRGGIVDREAELARLQQEGQERAADTSGVLDRLVNTAAGFASSFADSLVVSPLDAIGDLTGLYDIGSGDENTKAVNDFFGYNPVQAARAMENIRKRWEVASDDNSTKAEAVRAVGNGILEAFITPEMWGTSMGTLMSWVTPGVVLKMAGIGSKFANTVKGLDADAAAGKITEAAARAGKAKAFMSIDGAKAALTAESGHIAAALGSVNKQYEEFVENNNGVELEGTDKAGWFSTRFAVQIVNQHIDKLVDFQVMKAPGMIASLVPAVKGMTNKEFANAAKQMGKGVVVTAAAMGSEAAQEYTQTMMEVFNSRYGSEKFSDLDTFAKFITDERNTTEAAIGAIAGAGGAMQFEAAGVLGKGVKSITGENVAETLKKVGGLFNTPDTGDNVPTQEEVDNKVRDMFNASSEQTPTSTNPASSYYAAQGSGNAALVASARKDAIAAKKSILSGTHTVFNSDADFSDKLKQLDPIIEAISAEDPYMPLTEMLKAISSRLRPSSAEETEQLTTTVTEASERGKQYASIKHILETEADIKDNVRGFNTYFTAAALAKANGDIRGYEASINNLDRLYNNQVEKLSNIDAAVSTVRNTVEGMVDIIITQNPNISRKDALLQVRANTHEDKKHQFKYTQRNTKDSPSISYLAVIDSLLDPKGYTADSHIFRLRNTVAKEVAAMEKVYSVLAGNTPAEAVLSTTSSTYPQPEQQGTDVQGAAGPSNVPQTAASGMDEARAARVAEAIQRRVVKAEAEAANMTPQELSDKIANLGSTIGSKEALLADVAHLQRVAASNNVTSEEQAIRVRNSVQSAKAMKEEYSKALNRSTAAGKSDTVSGSTEFSEVPADWQFDPAFEFADEYTFTDDGSEPAKASTKPTEGSTAEPQAPNTVEGFDIGQELPEGFGAEFGEFTEEDFKFDEPAEEGFVEEDYAFDDTDETISTDSKSDEVVDSTGSTPPPKKDVIKAYVANRKDLKTLSKHISERRQELREEGITSKEDVLKDPTMMSLLEERIGLTEQRDATFVNVLKDVVSGRLDSFRNKDISITLFTKYVNNSPFKVKSKLRDLFAEMAPTGFTLEKHAESDVSEATKKFADRLLNKGQFSSSLFSYVTNNPANLFLYNTDGSVNYNTVEAIQAAAYEYLEQDASNLLGANRSEEDVAQMFGIATEQVTPDMYSTFMNGGVTVKLASSAVGLKVIDNLGIKVPSIQEKEALASMLGMFALYGIEGDFVTIDSFKEEWTYAKNGVGYIKGTQGMFDNLGGVRTQLRKFEEELGIEVDSYRTYRMSKNVKSRKVMIHNAEFLEAPREHQKAVNRLDNTAFISNDGVDVLQEMFNDTEQALVEHIAGTGKGINSKDSELRYQAQLEAVKRSVMFFNEAINTVRNVPIYFNWFIAMNHRVHLDSNTLNPQSDKNLARWLFTALRTRSVMGKSTIDAVLDNGISDIANITDAQKEVLMFAYGIVQAFDGVDRTYGIPDIAKNNETEVLAAAKKLLTEVSDETLKQMAMQAGHVGHAALAIANIRKYRKAKDTFNSDMVVEIDGLTNGFSFRALQFPLEETGSPISASEWLEKVGFVTSESEAELYRMDSMNEARDNKMEDVYISVGGVLQKGIVEQISKLNWVDKGWIDLFTKYGPLKDFTDETDAGVKGFIRNLMKSPVMIFNYAAGVGKIAAGLVDDQIMGTGYMKGKGLIDVLTAVDYVISKEELEAAFNKNGSNLGTQLHEARTSNGLSQEKLLSDIYANVDKTTTNTVVNQISSKGLVSALTASDYVISKDELEEVFNKSGNDLGTQYHKARVALKDHVLDSKSVPHIPQLKKHLTRAVNAIYAEPLKDTLDTLFGRQREVNLSLVHAATFLFNEFKTQYDEWRDLNPDATKEDKEEFLKDMIELVPGVAGAGSDAPQNKVNFLKNVLETTNNQVEIKVDGGSLSTTSVARGYGEPGVGPAVLLVLAADSTTLVKTINSAYRGSKDGGALVVHDAAVLGVKEFDTIKAYNNSWYTVNRSYSIMAEFVNALVHLRDINPAVEFSSITDFHSKEDISFSSALQSLVTLNEEVQAGRKRLFELDAKVGQFVGPRGTMEHVKVAEARSASVDYLGKMSDRILETFHKSSKEDLIGVLGSKGYNDAINKLEQMLKGCK